MNSSDPKIQSEITCVENGPYLISNVDQLLSVNGDSIEAKSKMALCRCGQSANKPFCDGTHNKIGFISETLPDRAADKKDSYVGKHITIHDNRGLCAHAGVCTDNLGPVFNIKREPWIDPDRGTVEQIMEIVHRCPSGALSYTVEDEQTNEQPAQTTVSVIPNGPYKIVGPLQMQNVAHMQGASTETRTLCRCGHSKNKPYCDGSHWSAGFKDE